MPCFRLRMLCRNSRMDETMNKGYTVYDQLLQLQKIPDASRIWESYRLALGDWICAHTRKGSTLLVLGAGPCNDIDLEGFVKHFSSVTLLDREEAEMHEAVEKRILTDELRSNVHFLAGDLVGIEEDAYRTFGENLGRMLQTYGRDIDREELVAVATDYMENAYRNRKPDPVLLKADSYDYILAAGLHSQLNAMFPQIWEVYANALGFHTAEIHKLAREYNATIVEELNARIKASARIGVIQALEQERVGLQGAIEGAWQSLTQIRERESIAATTQMLWPFAPQNNTVYQMQVVLYAADGKHA